MTKTHSQRPLLSIVVVMSATLIAPLSTGSLDRKLPARRPQTLFLQSADDLLKEAYVTGISQAILVLAGVCILYAAVVRVGLRDKKTTKGD